MSSTHTRTMTKVLAAVTVIIRVVISDVLVEQKFQKSTDLAYLRFENTEIISNIKSDIECAGFCDQYTWCNAMSWNKDSRICQAFTKRVSHEAKSHHMSNVFIGNKDICMGDGYTYTSGMCIQFFPHAVTTWNEAVDFCINIGTRLVVADTMEKFNYIQNQIKNNSTLTNYNNWWVAASKQAHGRWKWTTGAMLANELYINEDNQDGTLCLGFYFTLLDDHACSQMGRAICEK